MKGTFISSDYIKARDNSIRLVEVNTDTVVYGGLTESEFSWQPFVDFISGSYTTLHIISKPELHFDTVNALKAKVATDLPSLIVSESHSNLLEVYPENVSDSADKFILRMAYDENAILDSEYCANSFNALKLMHEYNHTSSIVPFYAVSGSTTFDTLNTSSYSENVPNAVIKYNDRVNDDVMFQKITDWNTAKSSLDSSSYMQSFEISSESLSDNVAWSYRNYAIAYGSDLSTIDLGTNVSYAKFTLPTTSQVDITAISSNTELSIKHYHEFSTSDIKKQRRREGVYDTEHFISASGEDVAISQVTAGQVFKSFYVPGMPDTDSPSVYTSYVITGSSFPSGSQVTGSVVQAEVKTHNNDEGLVVGLKYSGSDETYYLGSTTSLLSYSSGSDNIKFRTLSDIAEDDIYLVDTSNNVVDIIENKLIILNEQTGSFHSVNLEPVDNVVIGNTPVFFAYHNNKQVPFCLTYEMKVKEENLGILNINKVEIGNKIETSEGYSTVTKVILEHLREGFYLVDNGLEITNDHPIKVENEWITPEEYTGTKEYIEGEINTVYIETENGEFITYSANESQNWTVSGNYAKDLF